MRYGQPCTVVRSNGDVEEWAFVRFTHGYGGLRVLVTTMIPGRGLVEKGPTLALWERWQQGCTCACESGQREGASECDKCKDETPDTCHDSCAYCNEIEFLEQQMLPVDEEE